jgi:tetratricopeptide (TPR) repeat protein
MKGDKKAIATWERVPNSARLRLLNNIYCHKCKESRGIRNATALIVQQDLVIKGACIICNAPVARCMEISFEKKVDFPPDNSCYKKLATLAAYPKNGEFSRLLNNLSLLKLNNCGEWDPNDHELFDASDDNSLDSIYSDILKIGSRPCWEMEQVLPGLDPNSIDIDDDPILQGIVIQETKGNHAAIKYFKSMIKLDPRCIDAYAHIGNIYFNMQGNTRHAISRAKAYYKQGVAIGLMSIGEHLNDVFPWGMIDNRPFLRCLHGFGLCFLEQKQTKEALVIFKHMLLLNPMDNQGARMLIADCAEG